MYHEVVNEEGQEFSRLLYKVVASLQEFFYVEGTFTLDTRSVMFSQAWDPEGTSETDLACTVSLARSHDRGERITSWRQAVSEQDEDKMSSMFYAWCRMRNIRGFRGLIVDVKGFEDSFDLKNGETKIPIEHIKHTLKKTEGVADDNDQDRDNEGQQLGL